MRRIELANGRGVALVDDEDYDRVAGVGWCLHRSGYAQGRVSGGQLFYMHRFLLGAARHEVVDHVDHNKLNNCRTNLRATTQTKNNANRGKVRVIGGAPTTSQFKGVCIVRQRTRTAWQAGIRIDKRRVALGIFASEEDAARAYDEAARRVYGDAAVTNFPIDSEACALTLPQHPRHTGSRAA